jgi:hypothetical protein
LERVVKRHLTHDLFIVCVLKRVCPIRVEKMMGYTVEGV